jgi:hypothetical protein
MPNKGTVGLYQSCKDLSGFSAPAAQLSDVNVRQVSAKTAQVNGRKSTLRALPFHYCARGRVLRARAVVPEQNEELLMAAHRQRDLR